MNIRKPNHFNKYAIIAIVVLATSGFGLTSCYVRNEAPNLLSEIQYMPLADAVNINTASSAELQRIPHVGEKVAQDIIEHRERYGPFRKPDHLILIPGISDSRFRKMRELVRVD